MEEETQQHSTIDNLMGQKYMQNKPTGKGNESRLKECQSRERNTPLWEEKHDKEEVHNLQSKEP